MTAMEQLVRRQEIGEDLRSVVHVMKSLSAVSIKQFDTAAETLREYQSAIRLGLQAVLRQTTLKANIAYAREGADICVIVGSDRGLCGRFNEAVADFAEAKREDAKGQGREALFLTVGGRAAERMEARGVESDAVLSAPATVAALSETVESLIVEIDQRRAAFNVEKIIVVHNARTDEALAHVREQAILPVTEEWLSGLKEKPWPARGLPTFTVGADQLFSELIREHLFVSLFRAVTESVASEHASRLAAMQRAERHIEEFLATLGAEIREQRQSSITQELLDVVASFDVLQMRRGREDQRKRDYLDA